MPIYEFECEQCGEFFEQLIFGRDEPECPKCGAGKVRKTISSCVAKVSDGANASSSGCTSCKGGHCSTCRPGS